jgi:flagellar hook-associated protein FlgK
LSDRTLLDLIEAMEHRLEEGSSALDEAALESWNRAFQSESASAERGVEWPGIVTRAHALSSRIQVILERLILQREELKSELATQTHGKLALKAYNPKG